jgi:hypothetical protein
MRRPKIATEELEARLEWIQKNRPRKPDFAEDLLGIFGYTTVEASVALGVSPRTLERAAAKGELKITARLGSTQVFARETLLELVR